MNVQPWHILVFTILLLMNFSAFAGVRYNKSTVITYKGTVYFDLPEWIDLTSSGAAIEARTEKDMLFAFHSKEPWLTKVKARRHCDLNKGLLYFSSAEMDSFAVFLSAANFGNAVCSCDNPNCVAGASTSVPDKTYVTNFSHAGVAYLISLIIEQDGLTVTIIDENNPENYTKAFYAAGSSS